MNTAYQQPKAVIYARYSSHSQREQSIEGQMRVCREYADRQGILIVDTYIDRAISGTNAETRPGFQQMISDSKKKQFDYVIVYRLDRFARNRYDSAVYKHKLKTNNVRVLSAMENISDSPEGIILEAVLEASAEYYSKELSLKVTRGMKETAMKGRWTGGHLAMGYKSINGKIIIDEEKADIIRMYFHEYANGTRKKDIIAAINAKGYTRDDGKPYTIHSFQTTLKNKCYIGKTFINGEEYPNIFPPIIEEDTFEKVQQRLKENARAPRGNTGKVDNPLQGKLFCGLCGNTMILESGTGKSGRTYYYYVCSTKKKRAKDCIKKREQKEFVEYFIAEQTLQYVLTPSNIKFISQNVVQKYKNEFSTSKINDYEKRIDRLEREANKLLDIILETDSKSLIKRYEEKLIKIDAQKEDLTISLSKLKIANKITYTETDIATWLKSFAKGDINDSNFRQKLFDAFINSVYIDDDKLIIYYNIKNQNQITFTESREALETFKVEHFSECSTLNEFGGANHSKLEHYYLFVNKTFGVLIKNWKRSKNF